MIKKNLLLFTFLTTQTILYLLILLFHSIGLHFNLESLLNLNNQLFINYQFIKK